MGGLEGPEGRVVGDGICDTDLGHVGIIVAVCVRGMGLSAGRVVGMSLRGGSLPAVAVGWLALTQGNIPVTGNMSAGRLERQGGGGSRAVCSEQGDYGSRE